MNYGNAIRESMNDRIFAAAVYVYLAILSLAVLYPLIYVLSSSFSSPLAVTRGDVWVYPVDPSLDGYRAVFRDSRLFTGLANSLFYVAAGTCINIVMTVLLAYPLSRATFYGRNLIMMALVFTMIFEGGLIPLYLTVRDIGLLNTRWALLLPIALVAWQVIIARTFFQISIPREMLESASLDGAGDIGTLLRIVLPLTKPLIAVLVLMYAIMHWNSYFDAIIYLKTANLYPVQVFLREIIINNQVDMSKMTHASDFIEKQNLSKQLRYPLIVITSFPVLILYPFVQKHFVKGMMIGSLKG